MSAEEVVTAQREARLFSGWGRGEQVGRGHRISAHRELRSALARDPSPRGRNPTLQGSGSPSLWQVAAPAERSRTAPERVPHRRLLSLRLGCFGLLGCDIGRTEKLVKGDTGARRKLGVARLGQASEHVVKLRLHRLGKLRVSPCLRGQQHSDGGLNRHGSRLHLQERRSDQTAEIGKFSVIHKLLPYLDSRARALRPSACDGPYSRDLR